MKKPWLAAVLNIIPGIGYLYVRKKFLGLTLLIYQITQIMLLFDPRYWDLMSGQISGWEWIAVGGELVLGIGFIYDAYRQALNMNPQKIVK